MATIVCGYLLVPDFRKDQVFLERGNLKKLCPGDTVEVLVKELMDKECLGMG